MNRRDGWSGLPARGRDALARHFGIDARALAAFRVALGFLLLADLAWRAPDLVAFYTDAGVLPRAALRESFPGFARVSLHTISGAAWVQAALFLIAAGFALALVAGYRTTVVTVVSWVLLVSLHARNPVLLNGGDSLLRRLLFWGIFLPLGERWSVDALRGGESRRRVATLATAALLLQVVIVYTLNGVFKLRSDVWTSGEALRYVLALDQLTVFLGDLLAPYAHLLWPVDWLWLGMTLASVLLLLLTGRTRTLFVALFVGMHLGMALTMRLGLFPLISIAGLIAFLPGSFWDAAERRIPETPGRAFDPGHWGRTLDRVLPSISAPEVPPTVSRWARRLTSAVVAGLLAFVLVWNAATLGYADLPDGVEATVDPEQHRWDMFAHPRTADGWYVVPGELESGEQVDAFHGSPVSWDRPPDVDASFPSHRWFVYLMDLRRPRYADLRPHFGEYLCQRWNDRHDDRLVELEVYYVEEPTRFDGPESTRRVELGTHSC
jgi:hypothetical protein